MFTVHNIHTYCSIVKKLGGLFKQAALQFAPRAENKRFPTFFAAAFTTSCAATAPFTGMGGISGTSLFPAIPSFCRRVVSTRARSVLVVFEVLPDVFAALADALAAEAVPRAGFFHHVVQHARSSTSPSYEMPSPNRMSNSASRNGAATLFFTIFAFSASRRRIALFHRGDTADVYAH